jgi:hypothetical protein
MSRPRFTVLALGLGAPLLLAALPGATTGCNTERKQECDKFLSIIKPIDESSVGGGPSSATLDRMNSELSAIHFQDQPLSVYAGNFEHTLTVLSGTTKLKEGPSAPDGTDDLLKTQLKKARTDRDDLQRYCSP